MKKIIEIFKYIPGYEGWYEASNIGRIKSLKCYNNKTKKYYFREKILKPATTKDGYKTVVLAKNHVRKTFRIHRLVIWAFKGIKDKKYQINHIDCNKKNNSIENLEWVTQSENIIHAIKNNLIKPINEKIKVEQYDLYSNITINIFKSIKEASKKTNICSTNISVCSLNKRKSAGGYGWRRVVA